MSYLEFIFNYIFIDYVILSIQLKGLDLSANRIRNLDLLRRVPEKLPQLEILSLMDNEVDLAYSYLICITLAF